MTDGRAKLISELPVANSVSGNDSFIVNKNYGNTSSPNVVTNSVTGNTLIASLVGNNVSNSLFTTTTYTNTSIAAAGAANVSFFTFNVAAYVGVKLLIDALNPVSLDRTYGEILISANSTVANAQFTGSKVGATPIDLVANASISGNTVSLFFKQNLTSNVQIRHLATYFRS